VTRFKRVRAGRLYRYMPVPMDRLDPKSSASDGQRVRVIRQPGCPPPGTMGHAHVTDVDGHFLGLVCVNSLSDL